MAEKYFQKRQDSPTLKPNNQSQEFKLQKRKEKLLEILQAKRHPKTQSKDMISTNIGNITKKEKVLELWVDEPPEIRLPSPKEKTAPKKGGGVGIQNIPTRRRTPNNPEE